MVSHRRGTAGAVPLLTVLWFGTLWGATEALLGGLLHTALPATVPGRIMIAVAVGLMAYAVRRTGTPWTALGMACVAAPLKLFSAVAFALPVTAPVVLNPALAILAQGLAVTVVALVLRLQADDGRARFASLGAASGGLQAILYVLLVLGPGQLAYPPATMLQALGTRYPAWISSAAGVTGFIVAAAPWAMLAGAVGALAARWVPVERAGAPRPAFLLVGSATCLAIFFAASWIF